MNTINIPTFLNIDLLFTTSNVGRRYGAYVIDWLFKLGYIFLVYQFLSLDIANVSGLVSFLVFCPVFFYTFLLEWLNNGQTIGKKILSIKVIGMNGGKPSVSQCGIRWMFLFVDAWSGFVFITLSTYFTFLIFFGPFVGAIFLATTKNKQRIGDMAAQTLVISVKEDHFSINDTIYAYATNRSNYVVKYPDVVKLSDKDMTILQNLLEKAEDQVDYDLAHKLANHVKKILKIESDEEDDVFLINLLKDYNHLIINQQ